MKSPKRPSDSKKPKKYSQQKAVSLLEGSFGGVLFSREMQTRILAGLVIVALIFSLVSYRIGAARQRLLQAQVDLSDATECLHQLRQILPAPHAPPSDILMRMEALYTDGVAKAGSVLDLVKDQTDRLRVQALIVRGDLNFEMGNFPQFPGASTQPSLQKPEKDDAYYSAAHDAYQQVLRDYPNDGFAFASAHLGLAAIAEARAAQASPPNPALWSEARSEYQAILDSVTAEKGFHDLANVRLQWIPQLQQRPLTSLNPPPKSSSSSMQGNSSSDASAGLLDTPTAMPPSPQASTRSSVVDISGALKALDSVSPSSATTRPDSTTQP